MPSTIRCAASPARVAATVGTFATVRMPCIQPVATAYATDPWIARRLSSGPRMCSGNRHDSQRAIATGTATIRMIVAAPVSSAPNSQRGTSMKNAPPNAAAPPVAVATEFIDTTCARGTTCGSAADKTRRDEAGESVGDQRRDQDGQIARARREQSRDREHQQQPPEVRADEHQPPVPAVQQRAGEWAEHRVRQVQHGERARDGPRPCCALWIEQNRADESGREQAVAELAHHAQFEQPPEFG